jgi:hypothetical protein
VKAFWATLAPDERRTEAACAAIELSISAMTPEER